MFLALLILAGFSLIQFIVIIYLLSSAGRVPAVAARMIDVYAQGKLNETRHPALRGKVGVQIKRFLDVLVRVRDFFRGTQLIIQKGERSSARLSRNIQKAVAYSSSTVSIAHKNSDVSNKLSAEISEGSAAVEEINATIGSLKEQLLIQDRNIQQVGEAFSKVNERLREISDTASLRSENVRSLVDITAAGNVFVFKIQILLKLDLG